MTTPLPVAPSTLRPSSFSSEMDAFLAAMVVFQSELDAIGSIAGLSFLGNSTTSLTVGTGSKSLTVETGKGYYPGNTVSIAYTTTPTNIMYGMVTSYNSGTGALVVNVTAISGSGTFALWSVSPALSVDTSTLATLTGTQTLTNKTLEAVTLTNGYTEEVFAITDGGSVDINPANGSIQTWTLGASRTPTASAFANGQSMTLMVDDGSAYSITWSTIAPTWLNSSGVAPTLKTSGYTLIVLFKQGGVVYGVA